MAGMKELVGLMRDLEDRLTVCMRCGMCQAVCPLYGETGREADVARGKLALLDGLMHEMFEDPRGVYERLTRCALCGSCAANCPSGVEVLAVFLKARAILTGYMGLPPAKRIILRGLLAHPQIFDRVLEWGARFQNLITKPVNDTLGTSCARFETPLLSGRHGRHMKRLAPVPFHRLVPELASAPGEAGVTAAVFVGCLVDKLFPQVGEAVLKVLDHHGVGVWLPEGQACCGIPAASSGDTATFESLLRHNLERFDPDRFDVLVTACATCTTTIKKIWPMLAGGTAAERERIDRVAGKTMDVGNFLVSRLGVANGPIAAAAGVAPQADPGDAPVVTYHDPCHLKKSLGVAAQPRALIRVNPRYRLREMAESDWCCGLGGSFNLEHYDLSAAIGERKRGHVEATGCSVVATGCPACMIQLSDMLSRAGDTIAVKHYIELYAELLNRP